MGKGLGSNPFFSRDFFSYQEVASAPFSLKNLGVLCRGIWQSTRFLRRFRPDVVVGFGSYHVFPVLAAAFILRIPVILFESNSIPGKVNRLFSSIAVFSTVQFPSAAKYLKGKCFEVYVPFRSFQEFGEVCEKEAYKYFNLSSGLCIF